MARPVQYRNLINSTTGNIRASEGAGTTTLNSGDNRAQLFTLTGARTCVLPSTGVKAGEVWDIELEGSATNALTVNSSSGSGIRVLRNFARLKLRAKQDTPTTPAHWQELVYEEEGSFTLANVTFTAGGAPSTLTEIGTYKRNRSEVLISGAQRYVTAGTTVTRIDADIPAFLGPDQLSGSVDIVAPLIMTSSADGNVFVYPSSSFLKNNGTMTATMASATVKKWTYFAIYKCTATT